jgi:glycine/serine hydroxymethyltransferase
VNYQAIPGDEGFTASSALRLGVSEMTRFGMKEKDFESLAALLADAVLNGRNVGDEVSMLRENFQTMHYCFDNKVQKSFRGRLLESF